jgi:hypothetical protein
MCCPFHGGPIPRISIPRGPFFESIFSRKHVSPSYVSPKLHFSELRFPESHFPELRFSESHFPEFHFLESHFPVSLFPESHEFLVPFLDWVRFRAGQL